MVSKDPEIQEIYNKIKNYNTTEHFIDCECSGVFCDNCEQLLETKRIKNNIPFTKEINTIIKKLLSIKVDLYSNPFSFNDPIKKIESTTDHHTIWGDQDYHIVFINEGIRISMTKSFIEKISILNNILLLNNGIDKPMRLNHLCYDDGNTYKGPHFYITKLPLDSLIFEKPPEGFNVNRRDTGEPLTTYFKYNNLGDTIYNYLWYK